MASNPNVNKVVYGNTTLIDITDTTATAGDVAVGKTFYSASGARSIGTMGAFPELTITGTITPTVSGGSIVLSNLKYALTSDRTIGMIWGDMLVKGAGATTPVTMDLGVTVDAPSSAITIRGLFSTTQNLNTEAMYNNSYMEIDTSGNVKFHYACQTNNTYMAIHPVLVRFSDLA